MMRTSQYIVTERSGMNVRLRRHNLLGKGNGYHEKDCVAAWPTVFTTISIPFTADNDGKSPSLQLPDQRFMMPVADA